jgi:Domain of unknown function (DUF3943)
MPGLHALALAASIALMPLQQAQPDTTHRFGPVRPRPLGAVAEALAINVAVNRIDAWGFGQDWAKVKPSDWWRNLRLGWEWDEDGFLTNMFSHPYHGGLYFNAARANGLDYWEAVPLTFLGSYTWEHFGERFRPSLNDFFMTSFGGIALGEVFHRLGASIRDNGATGTARVSREIAALPFDPITGLNRLVRGDWKRTGANPPEHTPEGYLLRISAGARVVEDSGFIDRESSTSGSASLVVDLDYGDPFSKPYETAFDVIEVRMQLSPGGGGLNQLRASGRLFARPLNGEDARNRHIFSVNQRYDYVNNPAHRFGAQSVEVGLYSRWRLNRTTGLRTQGFVDGIVLGALDAPYSGSGSRTYDFGPGIGFRTEFSLERRGVTFLTLYGRSEYVHSVSGAAADHVVGFGGVEATIPVAFNLGLGLHGGYFSRVSRYPDQPEEKREFPEIRLFLVWTAAAFPSGRQ